MIAFVCHPYHRGGVTKWMADAAAEWRRQGHPTWFVTVRPRRPFIGGRGRPSMVDIVDGIPDAIRPTVIAPIGGGEFEFGTEDYRAHVYAKAVVDSVPQGTPVIVSDDPAAWRTGSLLADRHPFIGVLHADDEAYYGYAKRHAHRVSAWVCVSARVTSGLRTLDLKSDAPVATIPCGIPLSPLARRGESPVMRLVWIGRVHERQKRVTDLPRIADGLRRGGMAFTLDILGDGDAVPLLEEQIRAAGLGESIRLHGWCDARRIAEALAESDVLLLPSNFEGMPLAAMEAMGAGCGVVASRVSGLEDYATVPEASECLWTHDVGDVEAAVEGVRAARAVPPARRISAARRLAEREFSIERCVQRYEALLGALPVMARRPTPPPRLGPLATLWSYALAGSRVVRVRLREPGAAATLTASPGTAARMERSHATA